jgi:FdrA protein
VAQTIRCRVHRDTYRDSVELMRVATEIERLPGIARAALLMGTPANRELLADAGLLVPEAMTARPGDLVVAVAATHASVADHALAHGTTLLTAMAPPPARAADRPPLRTIAQGLTELPEANLAIVSTPGAYATAEALKALKRGLHVFVFSDNVPLEDEIELKRLAGAKHLLMMGPDCGTAILDGVPLGFANAVRSGRIGLVGASGSGLQQVSCLVDRLGEGVSQVIGVGGRDLHDRIGGAMMLAGLERLAGDPSTAVIVLVSKPPAPAVAQRVLDAARRTGKPVIVNFLGGETSAIRDAAAIPAATLEDAARLAVAVARGRKPELTPRRVPAARRGMGTRFASGQDRVRGLYSGGTLAEEAALILGMNDAAAAEVCPHTVVDLGADEFTVGRPHPMIDFRLRNERIVAAARDRATAVILLDVVLGHGAHPDPAGALAPAIARASREAARSRRSLAIVASVCGTSRDPQDLVAQEHALTAAGVLLAPSNAQAARLAVGLVAAAERRPST